MSNASCLIGIPTLNGPERLERLLSSIFAHTDLSNCTVLVADDGSSQENLKLNKDVVHRYGVEMLMSGRTGIASTWNRIIRHDQNQHPVIVLINDDIEVVDDWLDVLSFSVLNNQHIGMVGLNSYCGVTRAQALITYPLQPRIDFIEAQLSSGSGTLLSSHGPIFAFRRDVYNEVGGFDECYFVFYEELDFGISCHRAGYISCMASYPLVYHMGGATNSQPENLNAQQHLIESRTKFKEKWCVSLDELRNECLTKYIAIYKNLLIRQWNTQLKNWKD